MSQLDPAIVATLRNNLTSDSRVVQRMISPATDLNTLKNATGLSVAQLESLARLNEADLAAVFDEVRATRPAKADGTASGAAFVAQMTAPVASPTGPLALRMGAAAMIPTATYATIPFETAMIVSPSQDPVAASKFVAGIPACPGDPLIYPDTFPTDMRNKDGTLHADAGKPHPEAGQPILYKGAPYLNKDGTPARGVVMFNYVDIKFQGLVTDGSTVVMFNCATKSLAHKLTAWVKKHRLSSTSAIKALLMRGKVLNAYDRYPSNLDFVGTKLVPNAGTTVKPGALILGSFTRRREEQPAVFVEGPAKVDELILGPEGGVFLDTGPGKKARHVAPDIFGKTFTRPDGSPVDASELPRVRLPLAAV